MWSSVDGESELVTRPEVRFGLDDAMTYWIALGDVDGDGRLDIAVANSGGQSGIYLNRAAGSK